MRRFFSLNTLSRQLTLWMVLSVGGITAALVLFAYRSARTQIIEQTKQSAMAEVALHAAEIDEMVGRVASLVTTMAAVQGLRGPDPDPDVMLKLRRFMDAFPPNEVFGVYYTFENADYRNPMSMPWIDRNSYPEATINRNDYHIDQPSTIWYWGPKKSGRLMVSEPYFDAGGSDVTMLSVNAPVVGPDGKFYGISGVDISLADMRQMIKNIDIALEGEDATHASDFAYLVSREGTIIAHPDSSLMIGQGNPGVNISQLPVGAAMAAAPSGETTYRDREGARRIVCWSTAPLTGWKVVIDVPYSTMLTPVYALAWRLGSVGGAGLLVLLGVVALVARRVATPLGQLTRAAAELEAGQLDREKLTPLLRRGDEVGDLGRGFTRMAEEIRKREESLAAWNANLEKTVDERTAELNLAFVELKGSQEKLAAELAEAAAYVQNVLPAPISNGPVTAEWQFLPSSSLGGDAFGYGPERDGKFGICLLDVCGHGVGAALLSISVLNVIRAESLPGVDFSDPGAVLAGLNNAFPMEKHGEMFFTAWCGIYEPTTRLLRFASGGHPPAVLVGPDGATSVLAAKGPVIGPMPGMKFASAEVAVPAGARLFVFSDGAYEIRRHDGSMMSHDDLRALLSRAPRDNAPAWVMDQLRALNSQPEFDDDVSLVELRFP